MGMERMNRGDVSVLDMEHGGCSVTWGRWRMQLSWLAFSD